MPRTIVTTAGEAAARIFGRDDRPLHRTRHERAGEFLRPEGRAL